MAGKHWISIQLVSPASGEFYMFQEGDTEWIGYDSFHSISFPSEWGAELEVAKQAIEEVSIQLVSPASGEGEGVNVVGSGSGTLVSIQLVSPASGESLRVQR